MTDTVQETPAAATTAAPEVSADAETTIEQPGAESAPAKIEPLDPEFSSEIENVQKKFNKLTEARRSEERARRRAEEEREYWRQQALTREPQPEPQKPAPVEVKAKTLSDFEYDEAKYQAYLFEQSEQRATAAAERRLKEVQERDTAARRQSEFVAREREFAKTQADYYEVTRSPSLNISQEMVDASADSEEAAAVLYHLAKNPDVADRLARIRDVKVVARELGRLEQRLIAEREKAKTQTVSKAPPPTPKIEGSGDPAVSKDPSQMTDAEFDKWRRRQIAQRRSR